MAQTMSGIEAGLAEAKGEGTLVQIGRAIEYRGIDGFTFRWTASTSALAAQQLKIFRAASKYIKT